MAADRLSRVDEELAQLGKSDQELTAVRARMAAAERQGLEAVDAELSALAAEREGAQTRLAQAGAEASAVRGTFTRGTATPASEPDEEPVFRDAPWGEGGADPEGGDDGHSLSADDLFGDADGESGGPDAPLTEDPTLSQPPPEPAAVGEDQAEGGLADLLEGGDEPAAPAEAVGDFDISDSTDMMSADEVEAIRTSAPPKEGPGEEDIELLDDDELEIVVEDED